MATETHPGPHDLAELTPPTTHEQIVKVLQRIARALEDIADSLDPLNPQKES